MKAFVFDVESVGLHGEGFAVGGGLYENGAPLWEFHFQCDPDQACGCGNDRQWVSENVPLILYHTHISTQDVRSAFWERFQSARNEGAKIFVECGWPVEANFLSKCIEDDETRSLHGPYPLHEVATLMLAAGMDPMLDYSRLPRELPKHNPLCDARQSARLAGFYDPPHNVVKDQPALDIRQRLGIPS